MEDVLGGIFVVFVFLLAAMVIALVLGILGAYSLEAFCWAESKNIC
jgi:hypothetical protein